ncbi:hypothetical protein [Erysipelothrix rhusiopathiae]|uniref:hypothetical protein n=1 Tax=Erysipelothrix rhusiopathiae TaxID=1648 RepID=UPI0021636441|nr:hypothetical protein [Erysipelothrix rhusiopathiae]
MGFDGKSIISPRQIATIHKVFTPTQKEIEHALHIVEGVKESAAKGMEFLLLMDKWLTLPTLKGQNVPLNSLKQQAYIRGI